MKNSHLTAFKVLLAAAALFVGPSVAAMILYPGGYRLTEYALSFLGTTRSVSGQPNPVSMGLFDVSLAAVGVALMFSAWGWRHYVQRLGASLIAADLVFATTLVMGLGFFGIGASPGDIAGTHSMFVALAFYSIVPFSMVLAYRQMKAGAARKAAMGNIAFVVAVVLFLAVPGAMLQIDPAHAFVFAVVMQKIVVYGGIANLFLQAKTIIQMRASEEAIPA